MLLAGPKQGADNVLTSYQVLAARRSAIRFQLAPLAIVWALVLGYLAPLLGGAIPWNQDVALYFLPFKVAGLAMWRAGHVPLWTSLAGLGYPLLADGQAGLLYPPDVALFWLLPPGAAFDASVVGHALLGSALAYLFLRRLGLAVPPAVLGSIAFSFAGPILPLAGSPRLTTAAWWPGLLLAATGILQAKPAARPKWIAAGALTVAMMWLAGFPQVAVEGLLLVGGYAAFEAWRLAAIDRATDNLAQPVAPTDGQGPLGRLVTSGRLVAPVAIAVAIGTGLAAPQILATLELASQSARAGGAGALAGQGSLFPPAAVELFAPNWAPLAALGDESPNGFVGVVVLALGVVAVQSRRPGARFWLAVAGISLLLAFGRFSPLEWLLTHLPGLSYFRLPARFLYLTTTALAILAAIGLDAALRARDRVRTARTLLIAGLVLGGLALASDVPAAALLRLAGDRLYRLSIHAAGVNSLNGTPAASRLFNGALLATSLTNPRLWAPAAGVVCLVAVAVALRRGKDRAAYSLAVAGCLAEIATLGVLIGKTAPLTEPLTVGAVRAALAGSSAATGAASRIYSFAEPFQAATDSRYDLLPANYSTAFGIANVGLYAALGDPTYQALLAPLGAVDLASGTPIPTAAAVAEHHRLLDLFGASVVVSPSPLNGFASLDIANQAYIYRNPTAFPRAWVTSDLQPAAEPIAAALKSPSIDLHQTVLLPTADLPRPPSPSRMERGSGGEAHVLSDDGNQVVVAASGPGVLVLADRWAPGWEATVDGVSAPLWKADGVLRGVSLPPGQHLVRFTYAPVGFTCGLVVAVISVVLLGAVLVRRSRETSVAVE